MKFTEFEIAGAVALVTGGARGIGLAIARELLSHGAKVAIADLDGTQAERSAAELPVGPTGLIVRGFGADVGDRASYARLVAAVTEQLGPIDIVVNNAGVMPIGSLSEEDPAVAEATMRVNFWAHHHSFQILAPLMVARGRGHFINVTSAAGMIHSPGLATYVASKHAATGFARSAREELAGTGVTLSAVLPSAVRTELVDGIPFRFWERWAIVRPKRIATVAVGTLRARPAMVGAPRGLIPLLRLYPLIPEAIWLLGRRIVGADRTTGPIDRKARAEYDARITTQAHPIASVNDEGLSER